MKVELDDLVFNEDAADSDGVYWYITDLVGWDSPGLRQTGIDPSSRHGTSIAKGLLDARAMTLKGVVKAPTLEGFYNAQHGLQGRLNSLFDTCPLKVTEEIVRVVDVVRAGPVRTRMLGMLAFEFEAPLIAPDPLKYTASPTSTTIAAGATKTITNAGNFPSERFKVTTAAEGDVQVANLTVGTRGLLTDTPVESGTVFDFRARTVKTADERNLYSALAPASTWWALQPGANSVKNDSDVNITFAHYPAWL